MKAYGEYRWPYDMDGDLLPTCKSYCIISLGHNDEPHEEEG